MNQRQSSSRIRLLRLRPCLFVALCLLSAAVLVTGQEAAPQQQPDDVIATAKATAKTIDELGAKLVLILDNQSLTTQVSREAKDGMMIENRTNARMEAATLLSQIGYQKGVDALVRNITLKRTVAYGSEELTDRSLNFPAAASLVAFGDAGVLPVIQAAREETDPQRQDLYRYVIQAVSKKSAVPRLLLSALLKEEKDPGVRERLERLLKASAPAQ